MERGLMWWRTPSKQPVWLLVDGGAVVDATPYALSWARGWPLTDMRAAAQRLGATTTWTPFQTLPTKALLFRTDHTPIRRWRHPGGGSLADYHMAFGQTGDHWYVDAGGDNGTPSAWIFEHEDDAVALTRQYLAQSRAWDRVSARHDASGPLPDPPYDDRRWSDADRREERQVHADQ